VFRFHFGLDADAALARPDRRAPLRHVQFRFEGVEHYRFLLHQVEQHGRVVVFTVNHDLIAVELLLRIGAADHEIPDLARQAVAQLPHQWANTENVSAALLTRDLAMSRGVCGGRTLGFICHLPSVAWAIRRATTAFACCAYLARQGF
jgi:hypothetical protein